MRLVISFLFFLALMSSGLVAQTDQQIDQFKEKVAGYVESQQKLTQEMVDTIFSFSELGFQEVETSAYIVNILRENGFEVTEGIAGIPTAWWATWGSGEPVIALGSDIDGIPKASQKPGVAYHDPLVEGAPGHGEGHNSGQAVNVVAALAVKRLMEEEGLQGTLVLWPGVAEEQLATKAYYVRDGYFDNVDAVIFTHVSNNMNVSWGPAGGSGLVSVEYTFKGESAHSGGAPWRGRSALDAVELMNQGWNYRREHLRLQQRSHYVITQGGDQPNVVPSLASVWYFFREIDYPHIQNLFEIGNRIAEGAALMTDTEVEWRILGSAWPRHFNRPIAEATWENIVRVGLPEWSEADQQLARAVQEQVGSDPQGLTTELPDGVDGPAENNYGGGSDDIGDISWTVPTITLRYPANIPGLPGHHWSNAVAMATPIAHKGSSAGASVLARTVVDLLTHPTLVRDAWDYFKTVQTSETTYTPFIGPTDRPAVHLNEEIMKEYRESLKPYYYDSGRFDSYLEQLGIDYPTVKAPDSEEGN